MVDKEGHWVKKVAHEDHDCESGLPSTLHREWGIGSVWRCYCGRQWVFNRWLFWEVHDD